jgi:hypothetical protein
MQLEKKRARWPASKYQHLSLSTMWRRRRTWCQQPTTNVSAPAPAKCAGGGIHAPYIAGKSGSPSNNTRKQAAVLQHVDGRVGELEEAVTKEAAVAQDAKLDLAANNEVGPEAKPDAALHEELVVAEPQTAVASEERVDAYIGKREVAEHAAIVACYLVAANSRVTQIGAHVSEAASNEADIALPNGSSNDPRLTWGVDAACYVLPALSVWDNDNSDIAGAGMLGQPEPVVAPLTLLIDMLQQSNKL